MFYCYFPNCEYETDIRSQIVYHHIIPRSLNGSNKKYNRIYVCPSCHSKIYVPEMKNGIHSKKGKDSIEIIKWFNKLRVLIKIVNMVINEINIFVFYSKIQSIY